MFTWKILVKHLETKLSYKCRRFQLCVGRIWSYFMNQREYRLKIGYRPESEQSCEEDKSCLIFFAVPPPFPRPISVVSFRTTYTCPHSPGSLRLCLRAHALPSVRDVLASFPLLCLREFFSFKTQRAHPPWSFPEPPTSKELTTASFLLHPTQNPSKCPSLHPQLFITSLHVCFSFVKCKLTESRNMLFCVCIWRRLALS